MDVVAYFKSLSAEADALRDRIRQFIDDAHWPTDGEWKETVLRAMVRRSAPESITVGRGFVVTPNRCSSQIDLLLYDNRFPTLYKDGDLVVISPSACRGIVEVKTRVDLGDFRGATRTLAANAEFVRTAGAGHEIFVGLFVYEHSRIRQNFMLDALNAAASGSRSKVIDHVSFGGSQFVKFWPFDPEDSRQRPNYEQWHFYELEGMAVGYFIHNLLTIITDVPTVRREAGWFPEQGKEIHLQGRRRFDAN